MTPRPLLALLALAACTPTDDATESAGDTAASTTDGTTDDALVVLGGPCEFGRDDAAELALVTNNFVDPAGLSRVDVAARTIAADLLPATSDTTLAARGDRLVMVHRFGTNRLDVIDIAGDWTLLGSADVAVAGVAEPNPQSAVFAGEQLFVPLLGAAEVQVFDLAREPAQSKIGSVDLSPFADPDGNPDAGAALACDGAVFVAIQRLDPSFTPVDGHSSLVAIDTATLTALDLDPTADGMQPLALLGTWPKQFRRDPADPSGHTALVLTSGIERVDLSHGTVAWAVAPETLAAAGIDGFDVQAFALAPDGATIYLAATDGDFPNTAVFQVGLDGAAPEVPVKLAEGLVSGERMIEQLGGFLWVGDADPEQPRLRVWDLAEAPPKELDAPELRTDVAPWTLLPLP